MGMKKSLAGVLGFAAMMAMSDERMNFGDMPKSDGFSYRKKSTSMRSSATLTSKQAKERAKNKRAKLARRLNRC